MHTSNQGLIHTLSSVLCILCVPYYECSLPSVPFPLFPSLVPYQKQSVAFVTHTSPLLSKSVHSLPSSSLPTVPCPLSLLTIMFLLPFPIFDYVPSPLPYFWLCSWWSLSLMSLCYFYKIVESAIYVLSIWVSGPDNYYLCTKLCSKLPHYFSAEESS